MRSFIASILLVAFLCCLQVSMATTKTIHAGNNTFTFPQETTYRDDPKGDFQRRTFVLDIRSSGSQSDTDLKIGIYTTPKNCLTETWYGTTYPVGDVTISRTISNADNDITVCIQSSTETTVYMLGFSGVLAEHKSSFQIKNDTEVESFVMIHRDCSTSDTENYHLKVNQMTNTGSVLSTCSSWNMSEVEVYDMQTSTLLFNLSPSDTTSCLIDLPRTKVGNIIALEFRTKTSYSGSEWYNVTLLTDEEDVTLPTVNYIHQPDHPEQIEPVRHVMEDINFFNGCANHYNVEIPIYNGKTADHHTVLGLVGDKTFGTFSRYLTYAEGQEFPDYMSMFYVPNKYEPERLPAYTLYNVLNDRYHYIYSTEEGAGTLEASPYFKETTSTKTKIGAFQMIRNHGISMARSSMPKLDMELSFMTGQFIDEGQTQFEKFFGSFVLRDKFLRKLGTNERFSVIAYCERDGEMCLPIFKTHRSSDETVSAYGTYTSTEGHAGTTMTVAPPTTYRHRWNWHAFTMLHSSTRKLSEFTNVTVSVDRLKGVFYNTDTGVTEADHHIDDPYNEDAFYMLLGIELPVNVLSEDEKTSKAIYIDFSYFNEENNQHIDSMQIEDKAVVSQYCSRPGLVCTDISVDGLSSGGVAINPSSIEWDYNTDDVITLFVRVNAGKQIKGSPLVANLKLKTSVTFKEPANGKMPAVINDGDSNNNSGNGNDGGNGENPDPNPGPDPNPNPNPEPEPEPKPEPEPEPKPHSNEPAQIFGLDVKIVGGGAAALVLLIIIMACLKKGKNNQGGKSDFWSVIDNDSSEPLITYN